MLQSFKQNKAKINIEETFCLSGSMERAQLCLITCYAFADDLIHYRLGLLAHHVGIRENIELDIGINLKSEECYR